MFAFEKNIGTLKRSVYNQTDALDTITFDYCLERKENEPVASENVKMKRKVSLTLKEIQLLNQNGVRSLANEQLEVSDSIELNNHINK